MRGVTQAGKASVTTNSTYHLLARMGKDSISLAIVILPSGFGMVRMTLDN